VGKLVYAQIPVTPQTSAKLKLSLSEERPSLVVDTDGAGQNIRIFNAIPTTPPVAIAGPNQTVPVNSQVLLDGSRSFDPDSEPGPLQYSWLQQSGPAATLSGSNGMRPTFIPGVAGTYVLGLIVSDGLTSSRTAYVTITAKLIDTIPPVVSFSGNIGSYTVDQTVAIYCSASDNGSGVVSTTCVDVNAPAFTFTIGTTTLSATATDKAGNVGTGSATFTVKVTFASLIELTKRFVTKDLIRATLAGELKLAAAAEARGESKVKTKLTGLYIAELKAVTGKAITAENAAILIKLAQAL
jgi:hypothetical protein